MELWVPLLRDLAIVKIFFITKKFLHQFLSFFEKLRFFGKRFSFEVGSSQDLFSSSLSLVAEQKLEIYVLFCISIDLDCIGAVFLKSVLRLFHRHFFRLFYVS